MTRNNFYSLHATFEDAFLKRYPKGRNALTVFQKATGKRARWANFTRPRLNDFVVYMKANFAATSAQTYCKMFKSVFAVYENEIALPKGWHETLSIKPGCSEAAYLTEEEIGRLRPIIRRYRRANSLTAASHHKASQSSLPNTRRRKCRDLERIAPRSSDESAEIFKRKPRANTSFDFT